VPKTSIEREGFSSRLKQTLQSAQHSPDSPTELAREFNLRFEGRPITVHAARKWLVGEAIPTQDKLRTLSQWLLVPIEWLRFGGDQRNVDTPDWAVGLKPNDVKMLGDIQLLDEKHRQIAREFIRVLVRSAREQKTPAQLSQ
jgi:hypothetical protein